MNSRRKLGQRFDAKAHGHHIPAEADVPCTAYANSIIAITVIGITQIRVIDVWCEPIPVKIGRTPERSGEKPVLLGKDWSGEKPAPLAAKVPSGEKPTLPAAKTRKWEAHPAPAIPTLRNGVRRFHDYQRGHRSEKCDALQHEGLIYLNAPRDLTLQAHTCNRKDSR